MIYILCTVHQTGGLPLTSLHLTLCPHYFTQLILAARSASSLVPITVFANSAHDLAFSPELAVALIRPDSFYVLTDLVKASLPLLRAMHSHSVCRIFRQPLMNAHVSSSNFPIHFKWVPKQQRPDRSWVMW